VVAAKLLPADPKARQRIDRYELVGEIASGGMATVYLARRAGVGGFQRFVAVKRLHPHLAQESEFVQMFLDEARLAALIHHPNVVSITEVGASDRGYYVVMDYIEGDTLARLMTDAAEAGRIVPVGIGLRIVIDMLCGLHAAHELRDEQGDPTGLVHRDVSPQNVLVGLDGISRISDFGVARAASRLAGTRVGQLKGKIAYMAPEQAAGDEQLDRRADVFAAGILLWELLTGRRLFKASNDAATLSRVVTEKIEPPIRHVEGLDGRLSDVCMKALERPLSRRVASAAELAELLESAATRASVLASGREVASYMQSVMGDEVIRQREAVRRWVSETDSDRENTDADVARNGADSHSRHDRGSASLERSSSSSRTRPVFFRTVPDSSPSELTMVASQRRFWPMTAAALALVLGGSLLVWWIPSDDGARTVAKRFERLQLPASWQSRVELMTMQAQRRTGFERGSDAGDASGGNSDAALLPMYGAAESVAPMALPGASGRPRPPPPLPPMGRGAVIPDVDLTNPYR